MYAYSKVGMNEDLYDGYSITLKSLCIENFDHFLLDNVKDR